VRLPDGALIGAMGVIDHPDGSFEVGYWFSVEYQGKGYASEALRGTLAQIAADSALASRPIFAECRPDKAASIRLPTKTGFYATGRPDPAKRRLAGGLPRTIIPAAPPGDSPPQNAAASLRHGKVAKLTNAGS
jgi:[ribosomal protein S5]-alanine N-acetyltransferase